MNAKKKPANTIKHDASLQLPKLRFPEFKKTTNWNISKLDELVTFAAGGTPPKDSPEYWNGSIPWISASSMHNTNLCNSENKVTNAAIGNGTRIAKAGSILILTRGSMLYKRVPIGLASIDVAFNQDVRALTVTANVNASFLMRQLISQESRIQIHDTGIGAGKIDTNDLRQLLVAIPSLPEQQKIAACLSTLDDLIAEQGRKVDSLKTHKKGLMQQLFPREGETQPRLRFPEFRKAGEWESKSLKEIAKITSGSTPLRSNAAFFEDGTIPWVKTTDLNNSVITNTEEKITPNAKARINPAGAVLVAMYGGFNQIGRTGCLSIPAATNQAISVLVLNQKAASPEFVLVWLNAKVSYWKRLASSSRKDPNITGSDVGNFPIFLPKPTEQQRIASCLSSLDNLITAETQKLDSMKTHKKGLMQQLFPSPTDAI
jgi:type I restriction enzyme S subunit